MTTRQPRLLTADLQEAARLHPAKLSLDLRLKPLSTAELLLPASGPAVAVRDLIELYDENGSIGVFRVSAIDSNPGLTRTVYLEHSLATLSDGVIPPTSFTGSPREAMALLLSHQPDMRWQLGDVALPDDMTVIFTCGCTNLLTALMQLMELLPDGVMLTFRQDETGWFLHLAAMDDADACEGRLSRNLSGVSITLDGSDLCTRVYPYGAGQGSDRIGLRPLTGTDYLDSDAAAKWGCVSRTFTAGNIFDVPTLKAVAEKYLQRHAEPTASITARGIDLSAATGEAADSFCLGRMCRLALPEHDTVLHERIVALHKPDVIGRPGQVTLTLSNRLHDASDEIADMLREVTASQIIGGRVTDVTTHSRAEGTATSRIVHYFRVADWAAILACLVAFEPDSGVRVVGISVDNNPVPDEVYAAGSFNALPYLKRDELGVVTTGRHTLAIFPDAGAVESDVTLKVIEKI